RQLVIEPDVALLHVDSIDSQRTGRTRRRRGRTGSDERGDVPAAIREASRVDARPLERYPADQSSRGNQLTDAVVELDAVDGDDGAPVVRHPPVLEFDPGDQRPAEASDVESGCEVAIGGADDQAAQRVVRPHGLSEHEYGENDEKDGEDRAEKSACHPSDEP